MVENFTREDIPILGRLVSISEDNTVANAEQIWDSKRKTNQSDINQSVENRITNIETQGGLSLEYKNILDYLLSSTNLAEYNTDGWNGEAELNYWDGTSIISAPHFEKGDVRFSKNQTPLSEANDYTVYIEGSQLGSPWENALNVLGVSNFTGKIIASNLDNDDDVLTANGSVTVSGGSLSVYGGNIIGDTDIISDGDMYSHGLLYASDGVFIGSTSDPREDNYINDTIGFVNQKRSWFKDNVVFDELVDFEGDIVCTGLNINIASTDDIIFPNGTLTQLLGLSPSDSEPYGVYYLNNVNSQEVGTAIESGRKVILLGIDETINPVLFSYRVNNHNATYMLFIICDWEETGEHYYYISYTIYEWDDQDGWSTTEIDCPSIYQISNKQDLLVSGENIKTINGESLLGSGNISITGGSGNGNVVDDNYVHTDNNYTTAEKNKLANIENGAQVNVQADWTESNTESDAYIKNKPTDLGDFTNNVHYLKQGDIVAGNITSADIQNWNNKADKATTLSGYNILYDHDVFEEDENDVFTLNAQYKADHPVRMTSGDNQWTTDGNNKVPTVAAVYDKFLAKDDSTVVKTTGNLTIGGTKTFSVAPIVSGIKASGSNLSGIKLFTTNGSISTLKTINGNSLFGTGDITTAYSNFMPPTNNVAGVAGLVPAPAAGTQNHILSANGWISPLELTGGDGLIMYIDEPGDFTQPGAPFGQKGSVVNDTRIVCWNPVQFLDSHAILPINTSYYGTQAVISYYTFANVVNNLTYKIDNLIERVTQLENQ